MAMMNKKRFPYFEIRAYMGTTKHMGGLESTKELIELCQIRADQTVLMWVAAWAPRLYTWQRGAVAEWSVLTSRSLQLYLTNPDFREYMKPRRSVPKNLFDYLGYGYISAENKG